MKIAYTGWTWMLLGPNASAEMGVRAFEQATKEIAYLGYDCAENFAFIADFFPDPQVCKDICDKYNLPLVNVYGHFRGDIEDDYARSIKQIDFLAAIGGTWFNCQHAGFQEEPKERPLDKEGVDQMAELSNRLGKYAKEKGITLCFHPHAGTLVFDREQIDYFAEKTDPAYVSLCIDTAHTTLAGIDPAELVDAYAARVAYVHLKDVDPQHEVEPKRGKMGAFRALGLGTVDFKGFVNALKRANYDGVLCVELDNPEICNFHSAEVSRKYIKNVLKL